MRRRNFSQFITAVFQVFTMLIIMNLRRLAFGKCGAFNSLLAHVLCGSLYRVDLCLPRLAVLK
jgi:hypothetical protein